MPASVTKVPDTRRLSPVTASARPSSLGPLENAMAARRGAEAAGLLDAKGGRRLRVLNAPAALLAADEDCRAHILAPFESVVPLAPGKHRDLRIAMWRRLSRRRPCQAGASTQDHGGALARMMA